MVDGAKTRWCQLLLIDGLVSLHELREINTSSRRSFNQHQILLECIVEEVELSAPELHSAYKLGHASAAEHRVILTTLDHPWGDVEKLQEALLSDPTTKSKTKFVGIVQSLLSHPALESCGSNFEALFRDVVNKVLFTYPPLSRPSSLSRIPVVSPPTIPSPAPHPDEESRVTSRSPWSTEEDDDFDISVFDDLLASELDADLVDLCEGDGHRPVHPLPSTPVGNLFEPVEACGAVAVDTQEVWVPATVASDAAGALDSPRNAGVFKKEPNAVTALPGCAAVRSCSSAFPLVPFPDSHSVVFARRTAFGPAPALQHPPSAVHTPGGSARGADPVHEGGAQDPSLVALSRPAPVSVATSSTYSVFLGYDEYDLDIDCSAAWGDLSSPRALSRTATITATARNGKRKFCDAIGAGAETIARAVQTRL